MFSLLSEIIFPPKPEPCVIYESLLVDTQNETGERVVLEIDSPPLHSYALGDDGRRHPIYDARTFYR